MVTVLSSRKFYDNVSVKALDNLKNLTKVNTTKGSRKTPASPIVSDLTSRLPTVAEPIERYFLVKTGVSEWDGSIFEAGKLLKKLP